MIYIELFKVGDELECLRDIEFADWTRHQKGRFYTITNEMELPYYNINYLDYRKRQ